MKKIEKFTKEEVQALTDSPRKQHLLEIFSALKANIQNTGASQDENLSINRLPLIGTVKAKITRIFLKYKTFLTCLEKEKSTEKLKMQK